LRGSLVVVAVLALGLCFHLIVTSRLEHSASQATALQGLRKQLALGTAPTGQVDRNGRLLRLGTPIAVIDIPAVRLHQVVLEGTTSSVLRSGPGHLRNTVLPGQPGTSVIFGRAAAYGGPFGGLHTLHVGDKITVTTGIGASTFLVIDHRRAHDPLPRPLAAGAGRLTLVTATGMPLFPDGVLRVDADLASKTQPPSPMALTFVGASERPMAADTSALWVLVLLLQALILARVGAVWAWRRWGRAQSWIVFFPVTALLGLLLADQLMRLLPNLM
jgi:LPXTG-site transpeptidase (sortase) family protein